MEETILKFMSLSEIMELFCSLDEVADYQLKYDIIALVYCGATEDDVWNYIASQDED